MTKIKQGLINKVKEILPVGMRKKIRRVFPPAIYPPQNIVIEVTNRCNLHCRMCPQHSKETGVGIHRKEGLMEMNLYKRIIDEVKEYGEVMVSPIGAGEPLIHPEIIEMVHYAKEAGCKTHIITNGTLLTPKISERLINAGLDIIAISIDGIRKQTHEGIRLGSNFERVVSNIEALLRLKKDSQANIKVRIMTVELEENKGEISDIIDKWFPLVDEVLISAHRVESGRHLLHEKIYPLVQRVPCNRLWQMMVISWNGLVALCCDDWAEEVILGDVHNTSLRKIWFSKEFQKIRQYHLKGEYDKVSICNNCDSWLEANTCVRIEGNRKIIENPVVCCYTHIPTNLTKDS
ncbi:MAG: radical SAM protein [Nitrospirota bacterium]